MVRLPQKPHKLQNRKTMEIAENPWQAEGKMFQEIIDKDLLKGKLKHLEYIVCTIIIRKSFGCGQTDCELPLKELKEVASKPSLIKALRSLQDKGYIERIEGKEYGPKTAYRYRIVFREGMPYVKIKESKKDREKRIVKEAYEIYDKLSLEEKKSIFEDAFAAEGNIDKLKAMLREKTKDEILNQIKGGNK